jgi:hypothetical protein
MLNWKQNQTLEFYLRNLTIQKVEITILHVHLKEILFLEFVKVIFGQSDETRGPLKTKTFFSGAFESELDNQQC